MAADCNLLWLDLEMTGLDPDVDTILEIAVIATDTQLTKIIEGPSLVVHQSEEQLNNMNSVVRKLHTSSGLLSNVKDSEISLQQAEQHVIEFAKKHCAQEFHFAGNSIYTDRGFLRKHMPDLNALAHYRLVDVSALKVLIQDWYKNNPAHEFVKKETHRALDDIRESIVELQHYRKNFFI